MNYDKDLVVIFASALSARSRAQESALVDFETARFERRLTAKRATGAIVIDGALDEAAWREARGAARHRLPPERPARRGACQRQNRSARSLTT